MTYEGRCYFLATNEVKYYKNAYFQGKLSDANAEALLKLQDVTEMSDLKYEILNLPYHVIQQIIEQYSEAEKEQGFVKQGSFPLAESDCIRGVLRPEQTVGVAFMYLNGSCLFGDEVGLGKTVQIAGLYNIVRKQKAAQGEHFSILFLSEKTAVTQLRSKLIKFTGEYFGLLSDAQGGNIEKFCASREAGSNYSMVATHAAVRSPMFLESLARHPFDMLVFDESAPLRNTGTGLYYDTKALVKLFKNVIFLNATPVEIGAMDIYNQLNLIDPTLMPTKKEFESMFCIKTYKNNFTYDITGYKNTEVFKRAISLRYMARTRADLGGAYDGNQYCRYICPLTPTQRKLNQKTTLYQLCADYPTGVNRKVAYNAETCGKVYVLMQLMDKIDVTEEKVLIYVRYKECQAELKAMLEERGYSCAIINGEITAKARDEVITQANEGMLDVVITNIYRAYDLPKFRHCIFYTLDTNPQHMVQFEGRITRDIDVCDKCVYILVSEGKELAALETVRKRLEASDAFTVMGRSLVTAALMDKENVIKVELEGTSDGRD